VNKKEIFQGYNMPEFQKPEIPAYINVMLINGIGEGEGIYFAVFGFF
jgi:hypothetical protein